MLVTFYHFRQARNTLSLLVLQQIEWKLSPLDRSLRTPLIAYSVTAASRASICVRLMAMKESTAQRRIYVHLLRQLFHLSAVLLFHCLTPSRTDFCGRTLKELYIVTNKIEVKKV
jgi:hypothetical protein